MSEEKNGYVRMDDRDIMEINAVAEAWTRCLPMETVYEIAKRLHFHFVTSIFMSDKAEFEAMKEAHEIVEEDINRTPQRINDLTVSMLDKIDKIVGFHSISDEEMASLEDDAPEEYTPLPDSDFFKQLGLN